jgi:hypothetical protein
MSKFNVKIEGIVDIDGNHGVVGTCDDVQFEARPTRWGSKMLMKVTGENTFIQGAKIAIGAAAKKALKAEGKNLPEAVLIRPRKAKAEVTASDVSTEAVTAVEEIFEAVSESEVETVTLDDIFAAATPPSIDLSTMTVSQLRTEAKARGIKGTSDMNKTKLISALA